MRWEFDLRSWKHTGLHVRTNGPATAFMRRCIAHPGSPRSGVIRILPGRYGVRGTAIRETTITASSIATLATIWITTISRSEEHTSELQSLAYLVCRLLLEKKKIKKK